MQAKCTGSGANRSGYRAISAQFARVPARGTHLNRLQPTVEGRQLHESIAHWLYRVNPGSPSPLTDPATRALVLRHVQTLIARTQAFFAERQDAQLKTLRAYLFDLVDARPHTTQAQNLRTAAVMLDKQGAVFNRFLQAALREAIEDELEAVMPGVLMVLRPVDESGLSTGPLSMALLDVDEIERHLLVDRVAQLFNTSYDAVLKPLTQSMGALLHQDNFSLADNPFRPATFIRAFSLAWHASEFDPLAVEDFLSVLNPRHGIDWAPLYAGLTETLVRAGFTARPVHRIKRSAGGDSGPVPLQDGRDAGSSTRSGHGASSQGSGGSEFSASQAPTLAPSGEPAGGGGGTRTLAERARSFLQKLGFGRAAGQPGSGAEGPDTAAGGDGGAVRAPVDPDLMGFLGGLQAGTGEAAPQAWVEGDDLSGHNLLRQMREREEGKRAPELDRGTIDALAEGFDFVFADPAIPIQLKYVIGRLQIPVLKAAMIDRDFFLSGEHPARKLVDALAAAAVGWMPAKGESDPLYVKIQSTVLRVLNGFNNDLALFTLLLAEFVAFVGELEQQAQAHIEPVAHQQGSTEAHEAALVHADEVVHQCIGAASGDAPLLPFLLPFLTTQWREVMARAWMSRQSVPQGWEQALQTMDQMIWSTQPKTDSSERSRLVALLPDLVRRINVGLDSIGWDGPERAEFTRLLIDTHMKAIRSSRSQMLALESEPVVLETPASRMALKALEARRARQTETLELDAFDIQAQGFGRGLWFDFDDDQSVTRRYRLGWVSPQRTRLLFTNRDGFEAFVHSEREVARLLREGRLRVLDQQPIVERAINQIMAAGEAGTVDLELV